MTSTVPSPRPTPAAPPTPAPAPRPLRPGSSGEHRLQEERGTTARADRFYDDQVCDHLLPTMADFVRRMTMVFVATADARGACDSALRSGPAGFAAVLDPHRLALPEHRDTDATTRDHLVQNPHVGLLMVDFVEDLVGLHVNGRGRVVDDAVLRAEHPDLPPDAAPGRPATRWIEVTVEEAYVHCRKHVPRMVPAAGSVPGPDVPAPSDPAGGEGRVGDTPRDEAPSPGDPPRRRHLTRSLRRSAR